MFRYAFKVLAAFSFCLTVCSPCSFLYAQDAANESPSPAASAELDFSTLPEPLTFAKNRYSEALKLNALPKSPSRDASIKSFANALINYDEYAQRALSDKWASVPDQKKDEFKTLFKEWLELSYLKKLSDKSFKDNYNLDWDRVVKTKTSATVSCFSKQKDVETELELVLHAAGSSWQIYDILIDGASLAKTYQKKYSKKLDEKGVDGIMADMKAEIDKLKKM